MWNYIRHEHSQFTLLQKLHYKHNYACIVFWSRFPWRWDGAIYYSVLESQRTLKRERGGGRSAFFFVYFLCLCFRDVSFVGSASEGWHVASISIKDQSWLWSQLTNCYTCMKYIVFGQQKQDLNPLPSDHECRSILVAPKIKTKIYELIKQSNNQWINQYEIRMFLQEVNIFIFDRERVLSIPINKTKNALFNSFWY